MYQTRLGGGADAEPLSERSLSSSGGPGRLERMKLPYDDVHLIADPLYGYLRITLSRAGEIAEPDVIDNPWVQRLKRIHQLQSSWWVFPTAEHSRFAHSLGTMHLAGELARHTTGDGRRWHAALAPLTNAFVARFGAFLPRATYPVRVGTHFNTAFALALALDYAAAAGDTAFADLIREKANAWYGDDADCQAWEPGGDDFLSSALIEAECMRRAMPAAGFEAWLHRFLPRLAQRQPATLFRPAHVSDRSDGKIAHLDGLNLSRAWCWRAIARSLAAGDPRAAIARESAELHLAASLPHVAGDYMGEHWLATFALLALEA